MTDEGSSRAPERSARSTSLTDAEITGLLEALRAGDATAADHLLPLVYDTLHEIAVRRLGRERAGHSLQPTILIHDAWLRLTADRDTPWHDRRQFFALASRAMRRLLVDHARARRAGKRRGDLAEDLDDRIAVGPALDQVDLIALDDALNAFAAVDRRARDVVELRFFGGFEWSEIATTLDISEPTAKRDWQFARAWLRRAIDPAAGPAQGDPSGGDPAPSN